MKTHSGISIDPVKSGDWVALVAATLRYQGYCVVEGVISTALLAELRGAMYRAQEGILREMGEERLRRAGELGILRLMMRFDPVFFRLLELPEVLAVVDAALSPTAILHLQNGFILPSYPPGETPKAFQNTLHRDFPRHLDGYVASVNTFFAIDAFTRDNGATFIVPGSHQRAKPPDEAYVRTAAFPVECAAGSMLVFDSTLWHAAGSNVSGRDRLAINQQFTHSWIKQQVDYVRGLGGETVQALAPRTQQLLGWHTRVVTSLDEYYRPEAERLYRRGQG